jgi:hypothetical protein
MPKYTMTINFIMDTEDHNGDPIVGVVTEALNQFGYDTDHVSTLDLSWPYCLYLTKHKNVFTPEEEKEIEAFLENNKELMNDLAELEAKEKIDK